MATTLYNPGHPMFPKMFVGDGIPDSVVATQVKLAADHGYTGFRPDGAELPFMNILEYERILKRSGCPVFVISPTKFLLNLERLGLSEKFIGKVRRDSALANWWIDDRTFTEKTFSDGVLPGLLHVSPSEFRSHCYAGVCVDGM